LYELEENDGFEARWKKNIREENKVVLIKKHQESEKHKEMLEKMNDL
jgi:hypothetical protein